MKIVEPKYEILTDISEGGIKELQQIERVARVCYKSEDKITPDGESAKKLVGFLVKQGHEAMLEHSQLSVLFTCDRGVANELVRHRIASFAQESTRTTRRRSLRAALPLWSRFISIKSRIACSIVNG